MDSLPLNESSDDPYVKWESSGARELLRMDALPDAANGCQREQNPGSLGGSPAPLHDCSSINSLTSGVIGP